MAFLCPSRVGQSVAKRKKRERLFLAGRLTGSDSVDTLVRVGLEKEHGLQPSSYRIIEADFTPTAEREVAVKKGEGIYFLYTENDWTYVIKRNGLEGFVPSSFCVPCLEDDTSVYSTVSATDSNNNGSNSTKPLKGNNDSFDAFKGGFPDMANGYTVASKAENTHSTPRGDTTTTSIVMEDLPTNVNVLTTNSNKTNIRMSTEQININKTDNELAKAAANIVRLAPEVSTFRKTLHGQFIVLFDFEAQDENDIGVERAELVQVLNIEDPDWSWIKKYNGEEGFVPKSYICPVGPLKAQERLQRQKNNINNSITSTSSVSSASTASKTKALRKPAKLKPVDHDSPHRLSNSMQRGYSTQNMFFPATSSPKNTPDNDKLWERKMSTERSLSASTPNLAASPTLPVPHRNPPPYGYHKNRAAMQHRLDISSSSVDTSEPSPQVHDYPHSPLHQSHSPPHQSTGYIQHSSAKSRNHDLVIPPRIPYSSDSFSPDSSDYQEVFDREIRARLNMSAVSHTQFPSRSESTPHLNHIQTQNNMYTHSRLSLENVTMIPKTLSYNNSLNHSCSIANQYPPVHTSANYTYATPSKTGVHGSDNTNNVHQSHLLKTNPNYGPTCQPKQTQPNSEYTSSTSTFQNQHSVENSDYKKVTNRTPTQQVPNSDYSTNKEQTQSVANTLYQPTQSLQKSTYTKPADTSEPPVANSNYPTGSAPVTTGYLNVRALPVTVQPSITFSEAAAHVMANVPILKPTPPVVPPKPNTLSNTGQLVSTPNTSSKSVTFSFGDDYNDFSEDEIDTSFESAMEEQLSITDFNLSIIKKSFDPLAQPETDPDDDAYVHVGDVSNAKYKETNAKIRIPKSKPNLDDSMISDITEFVLLYDHKARSMDDLTVSQGERVFSDMQTNCNNDWVWAYSPKSTKYGFVPKSYLGQSEQTSL